MNKELNDEIDANLEVIAIYDPNTMPTLTRVRIIGKLLERCKEELSKSQWHKAPEEPTESGEYLCKLFDSRHDYCADDEWLEVTQYTVSKAFNNSWCLADFDTVAEWKHINTGE